MTRTSVTMAIAVFAAMAWELPQTSQAAAVTSVTVPAGTMVNVRLTEGIDVDVAAVGTNYRGRVDDPVFLDGRIIVPREAGAVLQSVKVAQSTEFKGSDHISLKLNAISFGGRVYQMATEYAVVEGGGEGKRTARKVGGGAGLGAVFGGIAGGGEGALIGAAVGAIAGTAVSASAEEHLKLPAETRLQFRLSSAVRLEW